LGNSPGACLIWMRLPVLMPGRNRDLVGEHEVAEDADAELTVRDEPQRRIEFRPCRLFRTEVLVVDEPLSRIREDVLKRVEIHTYAVVGAFDVWPSHIVSALREADKPPPGCGVTELLMPVLLTGLSPATRVKGILIELPDRQAWLPVELLAHEKLAHLLLGDLETRKRNGIGRLVILLRRRPQAGRGEGEWQTAPKAGRQVEFRVDRLC
jgi:hypothetical protein